MAPVRRRLTGLTAFRMCRRRPRRRVIVSRAWVQLHPMPRDLYAPAHPSPIVPLHIVHEVGHRISPSRATNHSGCTDRCTILAVVRCRCRVVATVWRIWSRSSSSGCPHRRSDRCERMAIEVRIAGAAARRHGVPASSGSWATTRRGSELKPWHGHFPLAMHSFHTIFQMFAGFAIFHMFAGFDLCPTTCLRRLEARRLPK